VAPKYATEKGGTFVFLDSNCARPSESNEFINRGKRTINMTIPKIETTATISHEASGPLDWCKPNYHKNMYGKNFPSQQFICSLYGNVLLHDEKEN